MEQIVEESLNFHRQSVEASGRRATCLEHDIADRLSGIAAPTLVVAGELDTILPPRFGRVVAHAVPGARFEVLPGEVHQVPPEVADEFNARLDAFWCEFDAAG